MRLTKPTLKNIPYQHCVDCKERTSMYITWWRCPMHPTDPAICFSCIENYKFRKPVRREILIEENKKCQ